MSTELNVDNTIVDNLVDCPIITSATGTSVNIFSNNFDAPSGSNQIFFDSPNVDFANSGIETESTSFLNTQNITFEDSVDIGGYIKLSDISEPSNGNDGTGRLYKKLGDDGLFWKPDSTGSEIDLTSTLDQGVFGDEFQFAPPLDQTFSTNSTTYVTAYTFTTTSLPAGNYRINWFFRQQWDFFTTTVCSTRVRLDGSTTLTEYITSDIDPSINRIPHGGFRRVALTAGIHTIDLDHRTSDSSDPVRILDPEIQIFRVP